MRQCGLDPRHHMGTARARLVGDLTRENEGDPQPVFQMFPDRDPGQVRPACGTGGRAARRQYPDGAVIAAVLSTGTPAP